MKDFADFSVEKINGKPARLQCVCDTRDVRSGHDLCRVHERPLLLRRERDLFAVSSDGRVVGCEDTGAPLLVYQEPFRGANREWIAAPGVAESPCADLVHEARLHTRAQAGAEVMQRALSMAFARRLPELTVSTYRGQKVKLGTTEDLTVIGGSIAHKGEGRYVLESVDLRRPDWQWRKRRDRHEDDYMLKATPVSRVRILVD